MRKTHQSEKTSLRDIWDKFVKNDFEKCFFIAIILTVGILISMVAPGVAAFFVVMILISSAIFLAVMGISAFFCLLYEGFKKLMHPSHKG